MALPNAWNLTLLAIGALGFLPRVLYAWRAGGSNDILFWNDFAQHIAEHGLIQEYIRSPIFNHPPLMGLLARGVLALSLATGERFAFLFKLPAIAADLGTGVLLAHAWSRRLGPTQRALAFALYGWSPISFLISAHHGNTDSICAMFILASLVLSVCHRARFAAGVALGAAINVKLIAVFCVPALLLAEAESRRDYLRFLLGLSLGVIPFVPVLIGAGAAFYRNAIAYNSNADHWGIPYLLRNLALHPRFTPIVGTWAALYSQLGRLLIVGGIGAVSLAFGRSRRLSAWSLTALSLALFLALAPGFGIQYLVYAAPMLFAESVWRGFRYACLAGLFAGAVYFSFWDGSVPYYTIFTSRFPAETVPFGIMVWMWLCCYAASTVVQGARTLAQRPSGLSRSPVLANSTARGSETRG